MSIPNAGVLEEKKCWGKAGGKKEGDQVVKEAMAYSIWRDVRSFLARTKSFSGTRILISPRPSIENG